MGALFPSTTRPDEISQRLEIYNKMRYERAVTVLFMSRVGDNQRAEQMDGLRKYVPDAECPQSMFYYTWDSYPVRDAELALAAASKDYL